MKREAAAALLLTALLVGAALNTRQIDRLMAELDRRIASSGEAAAAGDYGAALEELDGMIALWHSRRHYTGICLRHADVDAANEALYSLKALLLARDEGVPAACEGVRAQLEHLRWMEHLSPGTVL